MTEVAANVPNTADREDIREELRRIFDAPQFSHSPVMRRLMSFLVEQTLAGNGDRLKAYTIAVDALGRDPEFDPRIDSYPRVQVGRLRKLLDEIYEENGATSGLRIHIPKGAYVVRFDRQASAGRGAIGALPGSPVQPDESNLSIADLRRFAAAGLVAILIGLFAWQALGGLARADVDGYQPLSAADFREQSQDFERCIKLLAEDQCQTIFGAADDPAPR